jgi:hypothetical protein
MNKKVIDIFKKHDITVKVFPAKSAFLFSSLDRGFLGEFTIKFDNVIKQCPEKSLENTMLHSKSTLTFPISISSAFSGNMV